MHINLIRFKLRYADFFFLRLIFERGLLGGVSVSGRAKRPPLRLHVDESWSLFECTSFSIPIPNRIEKACLEKMA